MVATAVVTAFVVFTMVMVVMITLEIRVKGQLVRLQGLCTQHGKGHTAGGVKLRIFATEFRKAVLFPEHGDPLVHALPVVGDGQAGRGCGGADFVSG